MDNSKEQPMQLPKSGKYKSANLPTVMLLDNCIQKFKLGGELGVDEIEQRTDQNLAN